MTKVKKQAIRVRMAPSPTGFLHIGTARTALFNWLFARHEANGIFIIRIEDTDQERSKPEFEKNILEGLKWLGLKWDEFYRQSERTKIYTKHLKKLLDSGKAFWCYHSVEELEWEKEKQMERREAPRHVCEYKQKVQSENCKTGEGIIRLAVDENSSRVIHFEDTIRGHVEFEQRVIGDLSLAKDEQTVLYNFAVVVDDHEMKISHVIRGEDHIANTPKQILVAEALGVTVPQFAHLPLILGADRSKLSKRHGATMLNEYRLAGYLPEALVNFLALLGWSPENNQELLTKNKIIEKFDLKKVHKSGAIFDLKKLNWLNAQYLKMENNLGLAELVKPFVEKHFGKQSPELILKITPLLRERLEYLDQIKEYHYIFKAPEYDPNLLVWKKSNQMGAKKALTEIKKALDGQTEWDIFDEQYLRSELDKLAQEQFADDRGAVYWPLRVALSGEKFSPDPVSIMRLLAKGEVFKRIDKALEKI